MRTITLIAFCAFCLFSQKGHAELNNFFQKTDQFLEKHVVNGLVDYAAINENREQLEELSILIAQAERPDKASVRKAFYINAYNILAIKQVINHYPIESPKDVDGFFDGITHKVHGQAMTLDKLEKQTLFKEFPDARVHFAVICAAKGCPPMKAGAFQPDNLDQQLTQQTQRALSDPDFIRFNPKDRVAKVSQILKWYKADFLEEANSLLDYLNLYREGRLPADTRIRFYDYDWSLNAKKK